MSEITPVERFLGPIDPARGPFGLLGLAPADYDPEVIREALRARLLQLSRHRQAASTEADEVRLALHVAAAQLSDPAVRRLILRQQGVEAGQIAMPPASDAPVGSARPIAPTPRRTPAPLSGVHPGDLAEFQEVALRVLAHSGGWNDFAKRRLGGLAHAYGLDMEQLRQVLEAVAHERTSGARRVRRPAGARPGVSPIGVRAIRPEAGAVGVLTEQWRRSLAISTIALFVLAGIMSIWLLAMVFSRPSQVKERHVAIKLPGEEKSPEGAQATDAPAGETKASDPAPAIQPATSLEISSGADASVGGSAAELLASLRAAGAAMSNDPDASLETFQRVLKEVGERWIEIDAPTLQALRVELSAFQLTAIRTDREAAIGAAEAIAAPASSVAAGTPVFGRTGVARAAFSAGLMARLNRDDLTSSIGSEFRGVLVRLSTDGSGARRRDFWPGVALGMSAMARQYISLASDRERRAALGRAWSGWIEALERLEAEDPVEGQQLLLDTIERALIEGPDPALSQAAHDALSSLVAQMDFVGSDRRAPQRLLMWFDDARIPTSALSLVTSRIVFSSLIPGFGPEMMLRPDATEAARSQMRDDYALKLGLPVSSEDRAASDLWRARATQVLASRPLSEDPVAALERAGVLAMLNVSAALRWSGDDDRALAAARDARIEPMMEKALEVVSASLGPEASIPRMTSPSKYPDGEWARKYLSVMRNASDRQELINELRNSDAGPRGPVDADVLAEAASYGGPVTLRRSAQSTLERYAANLYILNGLLESLPNAARTPDVSAMLRSVSGRALPATGDPSWRVAARRAIVERVVELLGRRMIPQVEALEQIIRQAYEDRATASVAMALLPGAGAAPVDPNADPDASPLVGAATPAQLAGALRDEMASHARRFSEGQWTFTPLNELEQRQQARIRLARGGLQEFAAQQLGLTEMMAYVVAAERSSKADDVRSILRQLTERRRAATHVFNQIEDAEEAMLRLWLIRLGEEGAP